MGKWRKPATGILRKLEKAVEVLVIIVSAVISSSVGRGLTYKLVTSPKTGRVWLDRNLGATQVATKVDDSAAYGHLVLLFS
jgi:hypothetical protein